jgi:hypothetical protein
MAKIRSGERSDLAMRTYDRLTKFLRRRPLPLGFYRSLLHGRGQSDAVDRADLGEASTANHEARFLGRWLLPLWHLLIITCFGRLRVPKRASWFETRGVAALLTMRV